MLRVVGVVLAWLVLVAAAAKAAMLVAGLLVNLSTGRKWPTPRGALIRLPSPRRR